MREVLVADAVHGPRAMMIHHQYTLFASLAVVRALRLKVLASFAIVLPLILWGGEILVWFAWIRIYSQVVGDP